jgi:hypothetical protein
VGEGRNNDEKEHRSAIEICRNQNNTGSCSAGQTHLGIRTPLSQSISRSPNGWSPRMYWSGSPFDRSRHIDLRVLLQPNKVVDLPSLPLFAAIPIAFSLSQRSSFRADGKVRHSRRSNGRSGFSLCALSTNRVGIRGMSESLRMECQKLMSTFYWKSYIVSVCVPRGCSQPETHKLKGH